MRLYTTTLYYTIEENDMIISGTIGKYSYVDQIKLDELFCVDQPIEIFKSLLFDHLSLDKKWDNKTVNNFLFYLIVNIERNDDYFKP